MICSYYANYIGHLFCLNCRHKLHFLPLQILTLSDCSHLSGLVISPHCIFFRGGGANFMQRFTNTQVGRGKEWVKKWINLYWKTCWGWLKGNNCKPAFLQWQNYTLLEARLKQNNCKRRISNFAPRQILSTKADTKKQCKTSSSGKQTNKQKKSFETTPEQHSEIL